jgi:hypothetical protein
MFQLASSYPPVHPCDASVQGGQGASRLPSSFITSQRKPSTVVVGSIGGWHCPITATNYYSFYSCDYDCLGGSLQSQQTFEKASTSTFHHPNPTC